MIKKINIILRWLFRYKVSIIVVILTLILLPLGGVEEKVYNNNKTSWLEKTGVKNETFTYKATENITSYRAYDVNGNTATEKIITIDKSEPLGTEKNPYAINTPEDLILFGLIDKTTTENKYFILTAEEYDMQGDSYYMEPLYSVYTNYYGYATGFRGKLIGNGALIKNADIRNKNNYGLGLFGAIEEGDVWDIKIEETKMTALADYSIMGGGLSGSVSYGNIINCIIDIDVDYTGVSSPWGNTYLYNIVGVNTYANIIDCYGKVSIYDDIISISSEQNIEFKYNIVERNKYSFEGKSGNIYIDDVPLELDDDCKLYILFNDDGSYYGYYDSPNPNNLDSMKLNNEERSIYIDGSNTEYQEYCNVKIYPNYGDVKPFTKVVKHNEEMEKPNLVREGFKLTKFAKQDNGEDVYTFPYVVLGSTKMYAFWEVNLDYDELNVVKDITKDNVKIEDKNALNTAKDKLNEISTLDGLTQNDRTKIQVELDRINDALDKIEELENSPTPEPTEGATAEPSVVPSIEPTEGVINDTSDEDVDGSGTQSETGNETESKSKEVANTSTGDSNNIVFWSIITMMSGTAIVLLVRRKLKMNK